MHQSAAYLVRSELQGPWIDSSRRQGQICHRLADLRKRRLRCTEIVRVKGLKNNFGRSRTIRSKLLNTNTIYTLSRLTSAL